MKKRFNAPRRNNNGPICTGTRVEVRNDDVNGALRRLKKILENDNRQKELSEREYYEKPSITRRKSREQAKRRHIRNKRKGVISGAEHLTQKSGVHWMKCKRKRRRSMELDQLISASRRK